MRLIGKGKLSKLKKKNSGNKSLVKAIDKLISDIENATWKNPTELNITIPQADCIHSDGFFIFNIKNYRTCILIEFEEEEATVIWTGNHDQYERTFNNNKDSAKRWLKSKGHI